LIKINRALIFVFLCCLLINTFNTNKVKALENNENIIILIDNSGSMKGTDPYRLSIVAASMLIDTMGEEVNLNVIAFGDNVRYSERLSQKPSRESLKSKLSELSFSDNRTNLKEGIEEAIAELKEVQGGKTIIVLSDGKEDPVGGLTEQHMKELFELTEEAHKARIKVNCIGLSKGADEDTLLKISSSTAGDYFFCENPSELFNVFNKMFGNIRGFDTVTQFSTIDNKDKEIKLSSYIEEVIIRVASCDNTQPLTEVSFDNNINTSYKSGDKYKIYGFKNSNNNTITVTSKENENNFVIVQVKSKAPLNVNCSSSNFSIPLKVPMDIQVNIQGGEELKGLHVDKLEEGIRERIDFKDGEFKFTFNKSVPGRYPIFITAYDGEENIVSVKELNVNVKDYPPYYYTKALPKTILAENKFLVEVRQQDAATHDNPSGEVYVEYGDSYERIPFQFIDGVLTAEVSLKRTGDIRISSRIGVIRDNKSYSYYLPYLNSKVVEKAAVELQSIKYNKPFRKGEPIELKLEVINNYLYEDEKFFVYDDKENEIGSFKLDKDFKGNVTVQLKNLDTGNNFIFTLRPEHKEAVQATERIYTNIRIMSDSSYLLEKYKVFIIIVFAVIIVAFLVWLIGMSLYNLNIKNHKVYLKIEYNISSSGIDSSKSVELSYESNVRYVNFEDDIIVSSKAGNAIGKFKLEVPEGPKIIQGFKSILRPNNLFEITYIAMEEQFTESGSPISKISYKKNQQIRLEKEDTSIILIFL
jgi:hypothetical protein